MTYHNWKKQILESEDSEYKELFNVSDDVEQKLIIAYNQGQIFNAESNKSKKTYVDWKQIDNIIKEFIRYLNKRNNKYSGVYGPPRGGLIPAVLLSYKMNLPLLTTPTNNCIIIDDICDSGKTMELYGRYDKDKYIKLCLFATKKTKHLINFYGELTNKWIIFPWE